MIQVRSVLLLPSRETMFFLEREYFLLLARPNSEVKKILYFARTSSKTSHWAKRIIRSLPSPLSPTPPRQRGRRSKAGKATATTATWQHGCLREERSGPSGRAGTCELTYLWPVRAAAESHAAGGREGREREGGVGWREGEAAS